MRILSISFVQSTINLPKVLDWITSEETKAGKNTTTAWIIDANTTINNTNGDYEVEKLSMLLRACQMHDFQTVVIRK